MKVLAINGSPHEKGCTYTAIQLITEELMQQGIDTEIVHIGTQAIRGCIACKRCKQTEGEIHCLGTQDDIVNVCIEKSRSADGIILASPVHFAGIAGSMKAFLDRFFYAGGRERMKNKVGLSVVSLRRAGGVNTFQQLNQYLLYANMPIASSDYWNVIHGTTPEEVIQDLEGVHVLKNAARNMAWLLQALERCPEELRPVLQAHPFTNFIR